MLGETWQAKGANRQRTALTMHGLVIGVGAGVIKKANPQCAQYDVPDAQFVALAHRAMRDLGTGGRAEHDLGAGAPGQLGMPADEVGVDVRLDDVAAAQTALVGRVDVLLHIALRIDDRCLAVRPDQVRSMRQTAELELVEMHGRRLS